jgi:hypothetical protein
VTTLTPGTQTFSTFLVSDIDASPWLFERQQNLVEKNPCHSVGGVQVLVARAKPVTTRDTLKLFEILDAATTGLDG